LITIVFVVAFLYSSVGFGGASGYLAAMSLFALTPNLMASTALTLNILVATIAFVAYKRAGYFQPRLLLPFLLTSVPMSFVGGFIEVEARIYHVLLYLALIYVAVRLLFFNSPVEQTMEGQKEYVWSWILVSGALIGLLSGILGLGGGIFLSPLIVLSGWGTPKEAATSSAAFIVVNSISTILGRLLGGNFVFGVFGAVLLPVGLLGALGGSRLGALYFSSATLRRILGAVLLLAVVRYFLF
jgi:uncharacterized membrane protein YfcA